MNPNQQQPNTNKPQPQTWPAQSSPVAGQQPGPLPVAPQTFGQAPSTAVNPTPQQYQPTPSQPNIDSVGQVQYAQTTEANQTFQAQSGQNPVQYGQQQVAPLQAQPGQYGQPSYTQNSPPTQYAQPQPQQYGYAPQQTDTPEVAKKKKTALGLAIASIAGFFVVLFATGYVVVFIGILGLIAISIAVQIKPRPTLTIVLGAVGALLSIGGYLLTLAGQ